VRRCADRARRGAAGAGGQDGRSRDQGEERCQSPEACPLHVSHLLSHRCGQGRRGRTRIGHERPTRRQRRARLGGVGRDDPRVRESRQRRPQDGRCADQVSGHRACAHLERGRPPGNSRSCRARGAARRHGTARPGRTARACRTGRAAGADRSCGDARAVVSLDNVRQPRCRHLRRAERRGLRRRAVLRGSSVISSTSPASVQSSSLRASSARASCCWG
jgi:hypothetical protein